MICPKCGAIAENIFKCGSCDWVFDLTCPYCATEISEEWCIEEMDRSLTNVIINENRINTSNRRWKLYK